MEFVNPGGAFFTDEGVVVIIFCVGLEKKELRNGCVYISIIA